MVEWRKVHFQQQEDSIQKRKSGTMAMIFLLDVICSTGTNDKVEFIDLV